MENTNNSVLIESDNPTLHDAVVATIYASIIALFVSTCIGTHFIKHLCKQYICKNTDKKKITQGKVYVLFGIQIITTFARAISDLFMRTDYITKSYNIHLCGIGWYLYAIMPYVSKSFLFFLILYRTKLIFSDTPYSLDKCVFLTLVVATCIEVSCVAIAYIILASISNYQLFQLSKEDGGYFLLCRLDTTYMPFVNLITFFALILDLFWTACAGYIMITRLRKLRDHLSKIHRAERELSSVNSENTSNIDTNPSEDRRARFITKLEHIMYKQTVLSVFALASSVIFVIIMVFAAEFLFLFVIDMSINLICSWLLFTFSKEIWLKLYRMCCYRCRYQVRMHE